MVIVMVAVMVRVMVRIMDRFMVMDNVKSRSKPMRVGRKTLKENVA